MGLIIMYNVLVTGSGGFIGKNLIVKLACNMDVNILEFKRGNTLAELKELVLKSDFIYHIAGEVRPTSSDEEFQSSNVTLTKEILTILETDKKYTSILYVSSIHAKLLKNEYGKSKRESELLIESYAKKHNVGCSIYRLPHVFGEECKPNYNSVISTWVYNSINNLEINVYDRSIEMHYVYVQDIVEEFLCELKRTNQGVVYKEPSKVYETTLGMVIDYIDEFKNNIANSSYVVKNNSFKAKLFITYKDYWSKKS